jgi:hypothetical protein
LKAGLANSPIHGELAEAKEKPAEYCQPMPFRSFILILASNPLDNHR